MVYREGENVLKKVNCEASEADEERESFGELVEFLMGKR